jgi:hypothetical protein
MSTAANSDTGPKRFKRANTQPPQQRIEEIEDTPSKENKPEPAPAAEKEALPATPAKERRKPRKLVRNTPSSSPMPKTPGSEGDNTPEPTNDSLETRLQKLEQKYQNINKRLDTNAREIGRLQASTKPTKPAPKPSADTSTLPSTPQESTRKQKADVIEEDDDIETIPRLDGGPVAEQRSVALTGNYKIPLPSTLSTDDVRAIQSGIAAAGTVAREITAAIRTNGLPQQRGAASEMPQAGSELEKGNATPLLSASISQLTRTDVAETPKSPKSWSAFLSDCSKLVATAASAIEMEAAVEAGKKPAPTGRQSSSSAGGNGQSRTYQSPTKSSVARKHEKGLSDVGVARVNEGGDGKKQKPAPTVKADGVPKAG